MFTFTLHATQAKKSRSFATLVTLCLLLSLTGCNAGNDTNTAGTKASASDALNNAESQVLVSNQQEFNTAMSKAIPGQVILLADGVWQDFEMQVYGKGTAEQLIRVSAQTEGKVVLSGLSNLTLHGEYLEVSGLVFKNGYSPTGKVISFASSSNELANHSRVTRTVIDNFSNPDKFNSDSWITLFGKHNRFDHNHIEGKSNSGVTMAVRLNSPESQENYHRIDHNYFGPRPILGSNGGETLRIGTSKYSLSNSFTTVENNYFDRANGEVEIISNKSGKNVFRANTFFESRGTLTLRHGNGNIVENNVFLGNGKDHTGGIRVINADQTIRNNYMEGLTGIRFGGGFVVLNGVPNSSINRYHQVKNAVIENNTMVNVANINLAAGSDAERTAKPIDSVFANNLVVNDAGQAFKLFDDVSGVSFSNNISTLAPPSEIASGFSVQQITLSRAASGLLVHEGLAEQGIGASKDLKATAKQDTGVSWYPKNTQLAAFSSADTVEVSNAQELMTAIESAKAGTRILLAAGEYALPKILRVNTTVTIAGAGQSDTTIYPMRTILAELEDGGSLQVQNLTIDGERTPDAAGNVLFRNTRLPTVHNYRFALNAVTIKNLNVNHSAHVFDAGYRTLADDIRITDSRFENITGDILRLNKEGDDLGIYNAEYVTIENSQFTNVEGAIAKIYRGGTDESTFGPHFFVRNSQFTNIGFGKRNKEKASFYLHGVQDTDFINNQVRQSQAMVIEHTVGEPQTLIQDSTFDATDLPKVTEVFTKGESTAVLINNQLINQGK